MEKILKILNSRIKLYNFFKSVWKFNGRLLYTDTDSIIAAYRKKIDNEYHDEIFWDMKNINTYIKDAVFINPKTYALILQDKNQEIIKIKGINQYNISFKEIKEKFYNEDVLTFNNFSFNTINQQFELKKENEKKTIDLNKFDKRKFSLDKKETYPFIFKNWEYY